MRKIYFAFRHKRSREALDFTRAKGFTLIEVLSAITILVIIFMLVGSITVEILRFSRQLALQRQVNREARNISEMITREGRLAMGAQDATDINQRMQAIQTGHLKLDTSVPPKLEFDNTSGNTAVNFREVPKLGRAFGVYPDPNGSLNIVNQPYFVQGINTVSSADIVIVLDQSGSMMEPVDAGVTQYCDMNMYTQIGPGYNLSGYAFLPFGCVDSNGNGLDDEYQATKYYRSRRAIIDFIDRIKVVEDDVPATNDFRVEIIVYGGDSRVFSSIFVNLWDNAEVDLLKNKLDPNPAIPNSLNGVVSRTNLGQPLKKGFDNLTNTLRPDGTTADNRLEVLITDGKANFPRIKYPYSPLPLLPYRPTDTNPIYYQCPYDNSTSLPTINITGVDLSSYIDSGGRYCQAFGRDLAYQISENQKYISSSQLIKTWIAGYGALINIDTPLLDAMANFGGTGSSYTDLDLLFGDISDILNMITYSAEPSLGISTSSASLFQVSNLNFTTNNDKNWLLMDLTLETKDYATSPSWQKAQIKLHTFFTTRSYQ